MTPLVGGWLADSFAGRWLTILIFMIVYILGMSGLAVGAIREVANSHPWVALLSLFIVAIGTGGIKANVVTFGADQFSDIEAKRAEPWKQSFFNWFYFSINVGSFLSFTGTQEVSFTVGLAVPAAVMLLSLIIFSVGTRWYIRLIPTGSVIIRGFLIIFHSIASKRRGEVNMGDSFLDRAKNARNLSNGEKLFTTDQVDDLKNLLKVIPVLITYILFWTVYVQMSSLVFTQGLGLDLRVGTFTLPASSLNIFNSLPILLMIPLLDRGIYPLLKRFGINFSLLRRIGTGFCLASLAMVYSGLLEMYRLYLVSAGDTLQQKVGDKVYTAANLSVFAQVPTFFLIGAGEVFASVAGLEFAYSQAPSTMRSLIQALYLLTSSLGSYLGSALVAIVNASSNPEWINEDLNKSRLDLYFFVLAGLSFINFFVYVWISLSYKPTEADTKPVLAVRTEEPDEGGNGMPDETAKLISKRKTAVKDDSEVVSLED